jgi:hypothetical protein
MGLKPAPEQWEGRKAKLNASRDSNQAVTYAGRPRLLGIAQEKRERLIPPLASLAKLQGDLRGTAGAIFFAGCGSVIKPL